MLVQPVDDTDLDRRILRAERRIEAALRRAFEAVVTEFASLNGITAAGSVQDALVVHEAWQAEVDGMMTDIESSFYNGAEGMFAAITPLLPASLPPFEIPRVLNEYAAEHLRKAKNRMVRFSDLMWQDIRSQIEEGFVAGESIDAIARRIRDTGQVARARARTVARTEVISASNAGSFIGAQTLPPSMQPKSKTWLATNDARTRPTHAAADGQTVALTGEFQVGSAKLEYPGAPGPASEVINCRCTILFDVEPVPEGGAAAPPTIDASDAPRMGMGDRVAPPVVGDLEHTGDFHSFHAHIDPRTGRFTPERQALHDQIINDTLRDLPSQDSPELLFMGGGGGAGKTTTIRRGFIRLPDDGVVVNADDMKELIPEVHALQAAGDARWAGFAHEESSYIAKRLRDAAFERRINVTIDGTGSTVGSVTKAVAAARNSNYGVRAAYVSIDPIEGVRRAAERAASAAARGEPGRVIDPAVVLRAHLGANETYERILDQVDSAVLIDNQGAEPFIISTFEDGVQSVADDDAWSVFQSRRQADWLAERPDFSFSNIDVTALT